MPLHAHQKANVTVVVAGRLEDTVEGRARVCDALSVLVKPSESIHETRSGSQGTQTIVVEVDPSLESQLRRSVGLFDDVVHITGGHAARLVFGLWNDVGRSGPHQPRVEAWLEELGGMLASPLARSAEDATGPIRVAADLLASDQPGTSVASIASHVGIHPVSLARIFRREFGCTPCEFRRGARLQRAVAQLAESGRSIACIALETGFSDQSHLSRELRRESGLTPRAFRALAKPSMAV